MSEGSFWRSLSSWLYGGSSIVSLACDIAILVAITTIVRRHRPDAYRGLQLWAILSLGVFLFLTAARVVLPLLTARDGIESYFRVSAVLTILGTGLHVMLVFLLIRGLTALAQPPKPIPVEGAPPYR
jgi:hypothetical protein